MDLVSWTDEAWAADADNPEGVVRRLGAEALPVVAGLPPSEQPVQAPDGATRQAIARFGASLAPCSAGGSAVLPEGDPSDRVRVAALAAGDTAAVSAAQAQAQAQAAFDAMSVDDQGWCRASLDALPS